MSKDLGNIRSEYLRDKLEESNLPNEPFTLFDRWLEDARKSENPQPTAMTLSTMEKDGQPSSRIVLLKKIENNQFLFFTNYNSKKASDIKNHIRVSALFFWPELERQVKISGIAKEVAVKASDEYFHSRPVDSQISAWSSPQSQEISGRDILEEEFLKYKEKFKSEDLIPRPQHWGGFAIAPSRIEFWQGREKRLHDRIEFRKAKEGWKIVRLAP